MPERDDHMPERYVYIDFMIDTNRINAKTHLKNMNILECWHEDGVISIEMAEVAQNEAVQSRDSSRTEKAYTYIATKTLAHTRDEVLKLNQIQLILFPLGVQSRNNQNDVEIVFNAWKYFRILVTDDGDSRSQPVGILGNRDHLADIGIRVMRDDEAVELVKQKIIDRDQRARRIVLMEGKSLPDWVGLDFGERKAA